jgi:hypothetical protein
MLHSKASRLAILAAAFGALLMTPIPASATVIWGTFSGYADALGGSPSDISITPISVSGTIEYNTALLGTPSTGSGYSLWSQSPSPDPSVVITYTIKGVRYVDRGFSDWAVFVVAKQSVQDEFEIISEDLTQPPPAYYWANLDVKGNASTLSLVSDPYSPIQNFTGGTGSFTLTTTNETIYIGSITSMSIGGTAAVPETSTWTMMLIGFAGIGFAGYCRARNARTLAA